MTLDVTSEITLRAMVLMMLADGRHPNGSALLDRWLSTATFSVRDLLSREEDSRLEMRWSRKGPGLGPSLWMGLRIQVSVDGGPWVGDSWSKFGFPQQVSGGADELMAALVAVVALLF